MSTASYIIAAQTKSTYCRVETKMSLRKKENRETPKLYKEIAIFLGIFVLQIFQRKCKKTFYFVFFYPILAIFFSFGKFFVRSKKNISIQICITLKFFHTFLRKGKHTLTLRPHIVYCVIFYIYIFMQYRVRKCVPYLENMSHFCNRMIVLRKETTVRKLGVVETS